MFLQNLLYGRIWGWGGCCHRWANFLEECDKIEESDFQIHFLYVGEGNSIVIKYYSQTEKKDFFSIVDVKASICFSFSATAS